MSIYDLIPVVMPWAFPLKHRLVLAAALSRIRRQADMV